MEKFFNIILFINCYVLITLIIIVILRMRKMLIQFVVSSNIIIKKMKYKTYKYTIYVSGINNTPTKPQTNQKSTTCK